MSDVDVSTAVTVAVTGADIEVVMQYVLAIVLCVCMTLIGSVGIWRAFK